MKRPQITLLTLFFLQLLMVAYLHGKEKISSKGDIEKHNIFTSLLSTGITIFILYKGGFFN